MISFHFIIKKVALHTPDTPALPNGGKHGAMLPHPALFPSRGKGNPKPITHNNGPLPGPFAKRQKQRRGSASRTHGFPTPVVPTPFPQEAGVEIRDSRRGCRYFLLCIAISRAGSLVFAQPKGDFLFFAPAVSTSSPN